jgi:hypothetical protein
MSDKKKPAKKLVVKKQVVRKLSTAQLDVARAGDGPTFTPGCDQKLLTVKLSAAC